MYDNVILHKLGDSVANPTKLDAPDHVSYSDSVDLDSVQFPDDNYPLALDGTNILRK